jgi:SAM-dependent methyltransferase
MEKLIRGKRVLHFAPEGILTNLIKDQASTYETADFLTEGYAYDRIDHNIDISDMKEIGSGSFDCVIACDVLEHVPDHMKGIREMHRILADGGYCVLTVPQKDNLAITYEDLSITDPKEREKVFGQFDHLRIYGNDFVDMLEQSGFKVTVVNEGDFDMDLARKYVLFPPVLSTHPLATNYRKVFFGRKV